MLSQAHLVTQTYTQTSHDHTHLIESSLGHTDIHTNITWPHASYRKLTWSGSCVLGLHGWGWGALQAEVRVGVLLLMLHGLLGAARVRALLPQVW